MAPILLFGSWKIPVELIAIQLDDINVVYLARVYGVRLGNIRIIKGEAYGETPNGALATLAEALRHAISRPGSVYTDKVFVILKSSTMVSQFIGETMFTRS